MLRFKQDKFCLIQSIISVESVCVCHNLLTAEAAVALFAAEAGGGGDVINWVLFYSRFTFLENITQIDHKIPMLNSAFNYRWLKCSQPVTGLY